jgi:hypothetical protein
MFTDHKDVLRRFLEDAEAGRLKGDKTVPCTGGMIIKLVGLSLILSIIAVTVSIVHAIAG